MITVIWTTCKSPTDLWDLPFEGPTVFFKKTVDRLHNLKDSRETLKSPGNEEREF